MMARVRSLPCACKAPALSTPCCEHAWLIALLPLFCAPLLTPAGASVVLGPAGHESARRLARLVRRRWGDGAPQLQIPIAQQQEAIAQLSRAQQQARLREGRRAVHQQGPQEEAQRGRQQASPQEGAAATQVRPATPCPRHAPPRPRCGDLAMRGTAAAPCTRSHATPAGRAPADATAMTR